jgi:chromosome segregation ATPase
MLAMKLAALRKARHILAQYEIELKKLHAAMMVMKKKISIIKIKIHKLVNVIAKIRLIIGQANAALKVAQNQYAAFQKTVAAKRAQLFRRRKRVRMQIMAISKQRAYIKRLSILYKQKQAKVAELRILVAKRMKKLAYYKSLLVTQTRQYQGLTMRLVLLRRQIASLQLQITQQLAKIRTLKIKIVFLKRTLRRTFLQWKAELLLIRKKFKALQTNDLELRSRISKIKAYMAHKHKLKARFYAEMRGLIQRITILRQKIEAIQQEKLAASQAAFKSTFIGKVSAEGEEVTEEEIEETLKL